ncbi:MAG: FGGY family carbohydrate kinase, partial [Lacrimispora sp.]
MKNIYFMSIDLGTSFIKAGIYDTEGQCLAAAQSSVPSDSSRPGVFVQNGEEILNNVLSCARQATGIFGSESSKIAAIGFTGQMAGFMGVDKDWNDITSWSCSLDTRYVPYAEKQMAELGDDFLEIS